MEHIFDGHLDDLSRPVRIIVAARIAIGINPDLLNGLRVDRTEAANLAGRAGAFHHEKGIAVAKEVDGKGRAELTGGKSSAGIIKELLKGVRLRHPRLHVALLLQHHQRDRGDNIGNRADTGVDYGVGIEPLHAHRASIASIFTGICRADQLHLLCPSRKVGVGHRHNRAGGFATL